MAEEKAPQDRGEVPAVADSSISNAPTAGGVEQSIDPWSVTAGTDAKGNVLAFDYEALSKQWNTALIDKPLLERFERLTGAKPHRWLRRGLFFSHRDFNKILDVYEKGDRFLLYTGRGPSSGSMHIGHTIPFEFTKWLQDIFDVPLVIMLTDDEKFLFKEKLTVEETLAFMEDNAKDIIAMGFDVKKTFIYSDFEYMGGHFYQNAIEFAKLLPTNQVRGAFGFDGTTNIGRVFFPAIQCVAAFATSYPEIWGDFPSGKRQKKTAAIPCLIPMAIDQDPYFRLVRDNAHRMKNPSPKPALIHSKFLTALQGAGGKMSSSDPNSAIFMSDTKNEIKKKINKHAFSGGRATIEEHRKYGGNPDVDVPYQYLTYFMEDDEELAQIAEDYRNGTLLTGEMKQKCIAMMQEYVAQFQTRREKVTDTVLRMYMTPRRLQWKGNPNSLKNKIKSERNSGSTTPKDGKAGALTPIDGIPRSKTKPDDLKSEKFDTIVVTEPSKDANAGAVPQTDLAKELPAENHADSQPVSDIKPVEKTETEAPNNSQSSVDERTETPIESKGPVDKQPEAQPVIEAPRDLPILTKENEAPTVVKEEVNGEAS